MVPISPYAFNDEDPRQIREQTVFQRLDNWFCNFESNLSVYGYIPLASSLSGPVRVLFGEVQLIVGIAAAALSLLSYLFTPNCDDDKKLERLRKLVTILDYPIHGLVNIIRGTVESIVFVNLLCLIHDKIRRHRFNYLHEDSYPLERENSVSFFHSLVDRMEEKIASQRFSEQNIS